MLFNDQPTVNGLRTIAAADRKFGTTGLLPTLITDSPEEMRLAMEAVNEIADREPSVLGIHLEGPFISPEKPGVHDISHIRPVAAADMAMLTVPRQGAMLVTMAPERVPQGCIARLVAAGIRVSLGHSTATYEQTGAAWPKGSTPLPTSSMPCLRCPAVSPDRSPKHWRPPMHGMD